jgi:hypothetical protein
MDVLSFEFARLRKLPVVTFGFASQPVYNPYELKAEEERYSERIDAFARDFARTRRWPSLDEKDKYFIRERLRFAYEYAAIASHGSQNPLRLATRPQIVREERRILEWMLIDVWRRSGVVVWLDPIFTMCAVENMATPAWDHNLSE